MLFSKSIFRMKRKKCAPSRIPVFHFQHLAGHVALIETQTENPRTEKSELAFSFSHTGFMDRILILLSLR